MTVTVGTVAGDAQPIHVSYTVHDEFTGPVTVMVSFTVEGARKVATWSPGVARLYLGHNYGAEVQGALSELMSDLEG